MSMERISTRRVSETRREIWQAGRQIGTLSLVEDAEGMFWSWNVFVDGRFGGSSNRSGRLETERQAIAAAREWIEANRR